MAKQGLLQTLAECEYPAEFLVARLLGKKGILFRDWEFLIASEDVIETLKKTPFYPYLQKYGAPGIWRFLRNEHLWVYRRMNPYLRRTFTPYFVFHEIDTLIVCLRCLAGKNETEQVRQKLHNSLLHATIQKILTGGMDFSEILRALELHGCNGSDLFKGVSQHYDEKGFAALEILIRDRLFAFILSYKSPLLLRTFFQYLIDGHNCLALAKAIRWQINAEPNIINGGTVPEDRFRKAYFRRDLAPILKFLHLQDADEAASGVQKLETGLLNFMTGKLHKWSYQRTVIGVILFYLWEQYRYTRNISMVCNTILVDNNPVRENIVA